MSSHLLRDLGYDNSQVEEILGFIAGAGDAGARGRGTDAELSYRARVAANSNDSPVGQRVKDR